MTTRCDSAREQPVPSGCSGITAVQWICRIEGREVHLCSNCDQEWKKAARRTPALMLRCPNCAPSYYAARQVSERETHTGALTADSVPYTGPLADAIDRAMMAEGILTDVRRHVLSRLASDDDPYINMLLRSASGEAA